MEFEFPAEAEQFRQELRAFMDAELPDWWKGLFHDDDRIYPFTREFCMKLAERDWLTMSWPVSHGGVDADVWSQMVVREEMWAAGEPRGPQYMSLNYIGPMLMEFGTADQQERFLKPMAAGEVMWCQGFSEPEAGSDLAALSTRATDADGCFLVNGQKIWTSYATAADWCLLLCRTDPGERKHHGLSMLLVDMNTPGITVRPIDSMGGPQEFNEVFFDDVEVPYDCLLGPRGDGWRVAMSTLAHERVGAALHARVKVLLDALIEYATTTEDENGQPLAMRPSVRSGLVRLQARYRAARLLCYRVVSAMAAGDANDVDPAVSKVFSSELNILIGNIGLDIVGARGQLRTGDALAPLDGLMNDHWVHSIPQPIAMGTNEIQRNIISQRGLGLPR